MHPLNLRLDTFSSLRHAPTGFGPIAHSVPSWKFADKIKACDGTPSSRATPNPGGWVPASRGGTHCAVPLQWVPPWR